MATWVTWMENSMNIQIGISVLFLVRENPSCPLLPSSRGSGAGHSLFCPRSLDKHSACACTWGRSGRGEPQGGEGQADVHFLGSLPRQREAWEFGPRTKPLCWEHKQAAKNVAPLVPVPAPQSPALGNVEEHQQKEKINQALESQPHWHTHPSSTPSQLLR